MYMLRLSKRLWMMWLIIVNHRSCLSATKPIAAVTTRPCVENGLALAAGDEEEEPQTTQKGLYEDAEEASGRPSGRAERGADRRRPPQSRLPQEVQAREAAGDQAPQARRVGQAAGGQEALKEGEKCPALARVRDFANKAQRGVGHLMTNPFASSSSRASGGDGPGL